MRTFIVLLFGTFLFGVVLTTPTSSDGPSDKLPQLLPSIFSDELDDDYVDLSEDDQVRPIQSIEDLEALGLNVTNYPKSVLEDAFLSIVSKFQIHFENKFLNRKHWFLFL